MLEGELTFQVRDQLKTWPAGTFVIAPAGTPHTFANLGQQDARLLISCTPAGFEPYFDRLARERPPSHRHHKPLPSAHRSARRPSPDREHSFVLPTW